MLAEIWRVSFDFSFVLKDVILFFVIYVDGCEMNLTAA